MLFWIDPCYACIMQNRGVYMFRIDDNTVVDATMSGGPARYINHSCSPNCVAEVVPFEKDSKIIIIARRRIARGEEVRLGWCCWLTWVPCPRSLMDNALVLISLSFSLLQLTYDYKFDFEDDQHKIPCLCGAPNCRKWMNWCAPAIWNPRSELNAAMFIFTRLNSSF